MAIRVGPIGSTTSVDAPTWRDDELFAFEKFFLEEGIISGFAVSERGAGANMSVDVAAGSALIQITNTNLTPSETYPVYFNSDAVENIVVTAADPTNPRIDRVCLRIDVSTDPDAASENIGIIEVIAGTPAGSPSAPSEPSNAITLATVSVPAADTSIEDAQITDARTYVTLDTSVLADVARYARLALTSSGNGASLIGIEDAAGDYTGDTVEEALSEIPGLILEASTVTAPLISDNNSTAVGSSSTAEHAYDITYEIPANDLVNNVAYEFDAVITASRNTGDFTLRIKLGTTTILTKAFTSTTLDATGHMYVHGTLFGTAAAGSSVSVEGSALVAMGSAFSAGANANHVLNGAAAVATDGALTFQISGQWNASNASNSSQLLSFVVKRLSS